MVQLPSAPSESGNSRSTSAAASCAFCSTTPASQVMVLEAGIDLADLVEPREREDQFAVERDLPADQPGIAALRHERRLGLVGELEDRHHFVDRAGPQQHRRAAVIEPAALDQERRERGRIGDGVFVADDGREARQQIG